MKNKSMKQKNFDILLDKAFLGTQLNYPNAHVSAEIIKNIINLWHSIIKAEKFALVRREVIDMENFFSRERNGMTLRGELLQYLLEIKDYAYLMTGIFNAVYDGAQMKAKGEPQDSQKWQAVATISWYLNSIFTDEERGYLRLLNINEGRGYDVCPSEDELSFIKEISEKVDKISITFGIKGSDLAECLDTYVKSLDIQILNVSNTAKEVLKNSDEFGLMESFSGTLLEGRIQVAANRGYPSYPSRAQQDAVGSAVKDKYHFINIVADGVGGSYEGAKASKYLVDTLIEWFNKLDDKQLDDSDLLCDLLNDEVGDIHKDILKNIDDGQTTFVLALTVNDKTIIANVGDSTAYAYDEGSDTLELLSTMDSETSGLSYDDARFNLHNFYITASVGGIFEVHFRIIDNYGQRIILSSDGVTDIVSEEKFKSYFKNDADVQTIVEDALNPEEEPRRVKDEDNISAIVVDLPGEVLNKGRGVK